jgi:hypothetical protein
VQLQPAPVAAPPIATAPRRDVSADVLAALERQFAVAAEAPSVPDAPALDDMSMPALSLDKIKERYPLLRNAL